MICLTISKLDILFIFKGHAGVETNLSLSDTLPQRIKFQFTDHLHLLKT